MAGQSTKALTASRDRLPCKSSTASPFRAWKPSIPRGALLETFLEFSGSATRYEHETPNTQSASVPKRTESPLGFDLWRTDNQHMVYFNGFVQGVDWNYLRWEGYETDGLFNHGREMMDTAGDDPLCQFLSLQEAHFTPFEFAPAAHDARLPAHRKLTAKVPPEQREASLTMHRHYLAMILALDGVVDVEKDHSIRYTGSDVDYDPRPGNTLALIRDFLVPEQSVDGREYPVVWRDAAR